MKLCECKRSCMLTAAERYRGRIRCRYRHGQVKPLSYFVPPKPAPQPEEEK